MLQSQLFRRVEPRVAVRAFCSEYTANGDGHSIAIDLSESGLRLQRCGGAWGLQPIQIEFELPDLDEVIWADAQICFEEVEYLKEPNELGFMGPVTTSGIRLLAAAKSHQRLLREYVHFLRNERGLAKDSEWYSPYLPGVSNPALAPRKRIAR